MENAKIATVLALAHLVSGEKHANAKFVQDSHWLVTETEFAIVMVLAVATLITPENSAVVRRNVQEKIHSPEPSPVAQITETALAENANANQDGPLWKIVVAKIVVM